MEKGDNETTKLQATAAQPTEVEREETLSGEALVRLAVAARKQQEEKSRGIDCAKLDDTKVSNDKEGDKEASPLVATDKKINISKEERKMAAYVGEVKDSQAEVQTASTAKSPSVAPSDKQMPEQKPETALAMSQCNLRSRTNNKAPKEVPLQQQTADDLVLVTELSTVPLKRALMSDDMTEEGTTQHPVHGAFAMPGESYRDPPERQATQEATNSSDEGRGEYDQEANPWMPDDSNGEAPSGNTRGLDTTQGHRASTLIRNLLGHHRGDAARNSTAATNNMAIAQSVDDAEAVVYASKVEKARPRWVNWCLAAVAVAVILGLSLGLALTRGSSDDAEVDLGDPRCIKNITEQDVMDICHCTGNATNLVLVGNEILLYDLLHFLFTATGLMNQTYDRDSCANEHQALISLANFERYDVDFSAGIGFVTGDPDVLNHPNFELLQSYGIDVVEQQYIIKLLYLELGGQYWSRQENWMKTALVCEFEGITCALMERLQGISIPANNITGTLPAQLGRLRYLRTLDVSNNPNLVGTIPTEYGEMVSLREMDLSSCTLTGTLPAHLGNLTGLDRMVLHNNTLSGNIPEEFGSLVRMREVNFNTNGLQGSLPSGMFGMTNIENLQLKNNSFTGTIPEELGQLQFLETLDISYNNFTGHLPDVLDRFPLLNLFSLSNNQLSGGISETYCEVNADREILNIIITDCDVVRNCSCCARTVICVENLPSLAQGII